MVEHIQSLFKLYYYSIKNSVVFFRLGQLIWFSWCQAQSVKDICLTSSSRTNPIYRKSLTLNETIWVGPIMLLYVIIVTGKMWLKKVDLPIFLPVSLCENGLQKDCRIPKKNVCKIVHFLCKLYRSY